MSNIINLGLDIGNSETKVVNENGNQYKFKSLITNSYDELSETERIKVEYNGELYTIGIGTSNINANKYFSSKYKLMLLTAIAKTLDLNSKNAVVNITVSLPVESYKNKELKERIIENIKNYQTQNIQVNDNEYTITINDVGIYVEGGIIIQQKDAFKNRKIVIVDIGGLTMDSIEFEYGKIGKSYTERRGILILKDSIYTSFLKDQKKELDKKGQEDLFECVLEKKDFVYGDNSINTDKYYNIVNDFVGDIFDSLDVKYILSDKDIRFIGGGAIILSGFIEEYKDNYNIKILQNADYLNAKSNLVYSINNLG